VPLARPESVTVLDSFLLHTLDVPAICKTLETHSNNLHRLSPERNPQGPEESGKLQKDIRTPLGCFVWRDGWPRLTLGDQGPANGESSNRPS
jgi:hypothetical protein